MKLTLTIGIPTYNRAHCLVVMLRQLVKDIGKLAPKVEIIISDNCSTDNTQAVIEEWKRKAPIELTVRTFRKCENVGGIKNVVSLFYLAEAPFFMFLGDDDQLDGANLPKVIKILESQDPPSAVICARWFGVTRAKATGYIDFDQAAALFYEYGNSWGSIIDTKAAVNAVDARNLLEEIENIVWPQTVIGYLAIHDLLPRKVYAANFDMGGELPGFAWSITNKAYWVRSSYDLLKAASIVDKYTAGNEIRQALLKRKDSFIWRRIKTILWYDLVDPGNSASTYELQRLLRSDFGWRGYVWSLALKLSEHELLFRRVAQWIYMATKLKSKTAFELKLETFKKCHQLEVAQAAQTKRRFGNWF